MAEPTPRIAFLGEWTFFNNTSPPPANAQVRFNDGGQNKATSIFVSNITFNGVDASAWLMEMTPGYVIRFQDKIDPSKWQSYTVTGAPVANTGYVELKVSWLAGGTNLAQTNILISVVTCLVYPTGVAATARVGNVVGSGAAIVPISPFGGMEAKVGSVVVHGRIYLPDRAFPGDTPAGYSVGMTLRQYYATAAMNGYISSPAAANMTTERIALLAFAHADAMLWIERIEAERGITVKSVTMPRATPPTAVQPQEAMPIQEN